MNTFLPRQCVIDASVLIKYVVPEEETSVVQRLLLAMLEDLNAEIYVPDLLYVECANILWKKVQRGKVDAQTAEQSLADLAALELHSTPIPELSGKALQLACALQISAYDALYVALAENHGIPLLTADNRLATRMAETPYSVLSLAAYTQSAHN